MKISLDAAMRARDVSQATPADEMAAAQKAEDDSRRPQAPAARPSAPAARPSARRRAKPGYGSAGNSPDCS